MRLRHFLLGKFTAPVNDNSDSKKYLDSEILALYPRESIEFFRSLHSRLEPIIRVLKPPRGAEQKDSYQQAVLRLVIPRDTSEWVYIRVFPNTPLDHMNRDVMRYHAVLLSEQDLSALKWRPWRLDPYLFTGISADKVEGVPPSHEIGLEEKEVPIEFDIDFRMLDEKRDQARFPEQLIDQICSASEEGPIFMTEQSDPSALMDLVGEVAKRWSSKARRDRVLPLALGLRRVTDAKEVISNYRLSLLPPNSNVTCSGLATIERGAGHFPIREWRERPLPGLEDGKDKSVAYGSVIDISATGYRRQPAKQNEPTTKPNSALAEDRKPETTHVDSERPDKQTDKRRIGELEKKNQDLQDKIDKLASRERQMRSGQNAQMQAVFTSSGAGDTSHMKNYGALLVLVLGCLALGSLVTGAICRNKVNVQATMIGIRDNQIRTYEETIRAQEAQINGFQNTQLKDAVKKGIDAEELEKRIANPPRRSKE